MSNKYTIKNCPSFNNGFCTAGSIYVAGCSQCPDCVMKQIVERCKKIKEATAYICTNPYEYATYWETRGVLQLLDIQEVE